MKREETQSGKKLKHLKEIRRKNLEKNLIEIELKGYDHYVFMNEQNKAQLIAKGGWVTEHIRTAIIKYNYEIDKLPKLQIKDFTEKEIKEYERFSLSDDQ